MPNADLKTSNLAIPLEFLRAHGCDEFQGYYFRKPQAAEDFARLLGESPGLPAA